MKIRKVALITKILDEKAAALSREIAAWLEAKGVEVSRCEPGLGDLDCDADLMICLGGDGTIIRAARRIIGRQVPIVGVNMGRVGFLARLGQNNWRDGLGAALEKGFKVDQRLALVYEIQRRGELVQRGFAVNDVVISRGGLARLLELDLSVEDSKLQYLRADGLIISTPVGSTAYSSSAGGPILHPAIHAYSITAICPFLNKMLPMVVDGDTNFTVGVCEAGAQPFVTIDGQELFELEAEDVIQIRAEKNAVGFASIGKSSYVAKLRSSGYVTDSPGSPPNPYQD